MSAYYSQMTLRDLKEVAKAHGLKDYLLLDKEKLAELLTSTLKSPEKNLKTKKSVMTMLQKENENVKSLHSVNPEILKSLESQILPDTLIKKKRGRKPKIQENIIKSEETTTKPRGRKPKVVQELLPSTEIIKRGRKPKSLIHVEPKIEGLVEPKIELKVEPHLPIATQEVVSKKKPKKKTKKTKKKLPPSSPVIKDFFWKFILFK